MTWGEFQVEKELYKLAWVEMKKPFSGPIQDFLKQSSLVVSCGRVFDIDAKLEMAARECPAFFIDDLKTIGIPSDAAALPVIDNWHVEIIFPYVHIDFIQELKSSPFCDTAKTLMKVSSTDVVILKYPKPGQ